MEMRKIVGLLIVCVLMLSLIGMVSAISYENGSEANVINSPADNWLGRIISNIQYTIFKSGTFTVYGDELKCEKVSSDIITWKNNIISGKTKYIHLDPGDAMFINWFRGSPNDGIYSDHPGDSRQFMEEVYLEYGKTPNNQYAITCDASSYWNNDCYFDVYKCPLPCYLDSDCDSGEYCEKTILSQKIPNAGVCKTANPTHITKVYRCADGIKTPLDGVTYGNINFCINPQDSKYLTGTTDQCLSYEPTACSQVIECSSGTKCGDAESGLGTTYYTCSNNAWVSQGYDFEKCGCNKISLFGKDICVANSCSWSLGMCKGGTNETNTTSTYTKYPLTKEQISKSTSGDLLSAACYGNNECLSIENYTSSCIPVATLVSEGTMIKSQQNDFFSDGKAVLTSGLLGGGAALTMCAITGVATGGVALIGCAIGGAALNIGFVQALSGTVNDVGGIFSSDLQKAINKGDSSKVGICTAEETGGDFFKSLAFFKITGNKNTDGIIIFFGGIFLLMWMFSMMGGRK